MGQSAQVWLKLFAQYRKARQTGSLSYMVYNFWSAVRGLSITRCSRFNNYSYTCPGLSDAPERTHCCLWDGQPKRSVDWPTFLWCRVLTKPSFVRLFGSLTFRFLKRWIFFSKDWFQILQDLFCFGQSMRSVAIITRTWLRSLPGGSYLVQSRKRRSWVENGVFAYHPHWHWGKRSSS